MPRVVDVERRRSELAAAAARVIARAGIAGASMREVAAEAGWTTGTLAHYFGDKRELLQFTLGESLVRRRSRRSDREAMSPAEALRDALEGALPLDEAARLHWSVTVAFCAYSHTDPELARTQRDAYRDFRDDLTRLVRRSNPALAAAAAQDEAVRLITVVDGVAIQALFDPESWPPARQRQALDEALSRADRGCSQ